MHKYRDIHLSELRFRLIPQPLSFFMHHTLKQSQWNSIQRALSSYLFHMPRSVKYQNKKKVSL